MKNQNLIKISGNHVLLDGQSDIISSMQRTLMSSKDFKIAGQQSNATEFERVGETNELKFAPAGLPLILYFDSHVTKVTAQMGRIDSTGAIDIWSEDILATWLSSGEDHGPINASQLVFKVYMTEGYVIDDVVSSGNTETAVTGQIDTLFCLSQSGGSSMEDQIITITTKKKKAVKQTVDVSTLSEWTNLSAGDHQIIMKTKANGYKDSAGSNAVSVTKAAVGYNVTITNTDYHTFDVYDGVSTSGQLLGHADEYATMSVVCTSGSLFFDSGDLYQRDAVVTGGVSLKSSSSYDATFNVVGDGTITLSFACLIEGTQVSLADGSTKAIENITYEDELLVWDFHKGCMSKAKPRFIKVEQTTNKYCLVKFSNGAKIGFVGPGDQVRERDGGQGYHRIFNKEAGAFTYVGTEDTPLSTTTFAKDGSFPTVTSQEVIERPVKFYNIITENHFNIFANGILTSCRLSNMYKIENMKYIGEKFIADEQVEEYFTKRKAITKPRD